MIGLGKTTLDGTFHFTRHYVKEYLIAHKADVLSAHDLSKAIAHAIKSKPGWHTAVLEFDDSVSEQKLVKEPLRHYPFGIKDIGAVLYVTDGFRMWRYFQLGSGYFISNYDLNQMYKDKPQPAFKDKLVESDEKSELPKLAIDTSIRRKALVQRAQTQLERAQNEEELARKATEAEKPAEMRPLYCIVMFWVALRSSHPRHGW